MKKNRLILPRNLSEWIENSLRYEGIKLLDLNTDIIIASHDLNKNFHKDPADQLIAATSIVYKIPLLTMDKQILENRDVETINL